MGQYSNGIHYIEKGTGAPVILIHGASSNLNDYVSSGILHRLAEKYRVIALDRPGSGQSLGPKKKNRNPLQYQVDKIAEFLDMLNVEKPILMGHSLGGAIVAALAAQEAMCIKGLMILAGAVHPVVNGRNWHTTLATLPLIGPLSRHYLLPYLGSILVKKALVNNFSPNPVPQNYIESSQLLQLFSPKNFLNNSVDLNAARSFIDKNYLLYKNIKAPVSLIYGDKDQIICTYTNSQWFKTAVPQANLHMLRNVGHLPHHFHQDLIERELQRISTASC